MFNGCTSLTDLDISSFDARLVANSDDVFKAPPREQEYENAFEAEYMKQINEKMNNE